MKTSPTRNQRETSLTSKLDSVKSLWTDTLLLLIGEGTSSDCLLGFPSTTYLVLRSARFSLSLATRLRLRGLIWLSRSPPSLLGWLETGQMEQSVPNESGRRG